MNLIDGLIQQVSPRWAFQRAQYRGALAAYEAAEPGRLRKNRPDNRSGDALTAKAGSTIRGYARQQEQNYDLAEGILATLVDNVIGPNGITVEPMPLNKDGKIHTEFVKQIQDLRKDWNRKPEVTWEHNWVAVERLACRAWLRDGEYLAQFVEGLRGDLEHGTRVPLSLELIEADLLPMTLTDTSKGIVQGVQRNAWGRTTFYHLLKEHPGDVNFTHIHQDTKPVPADRILHPKIVKRFKQARGVSIFAPMMRRIEGIKDYEESELVAARVAAAFCAYIKKGVSEDYVGPDDPDADRSFKVKPGIIFDKLEPGEEIGTVDSNRPSSLLEGFRDSMVRMLAAASRGTFSSISRKYDGTYSAQRQELVEGYVAYKALSMLFGGQFGYPVHKRFIDIAVLSGQLRIPSDLDRNTLHDAEVRGPSMPWIDPDKEAKANERLEKAGHRSAQQNIRAGGGDPRRVMDEIEDWRKEADQRGLVFSTDPKHELAPTPEPVVVEPAEN